MKMEEAIKRIKTRFDKWALDNEDMKAIQTLIPELAESEDERMINFLYCELITLCAKECNEGGNGSDRYNTLVAAMAWLEKQKEQKPAKWSEEDKTMLERCISKMTNIIPVPGKQGLTNISFEKHTDEKLEAWLKSLPERFNLQPHWKPSEEQMFALDSAILMFHNLKRGGDKYGLESLYADLKKLM